MVNIQLLEKIDNTYACNLNLGYSYNIIIREYCMHFLLNSDFQVRSIGHEVCNRIIRIIGEYPWMGTISCLGILIGRQKCGPFLSDTIIIDPIG